MADLFENVVNFAFVILEIIIISGIIIRVLYNFLSKEREEWAIVINRQSYEKQTYSKSQAPIVKKEYIITFKCRNKDRHFKVSRLSYSNYRINQKGILRYKGNRLIDFK